MQSLHQLLERESLVNSSAVFVYDTTPTSPFGANLTKESDSDAEVWQMQTRAGAGSSLVGYVESVAFSSKGAQVKQSGEQETEDASSIPAKRQTRSRSDSTKKAKTAVSTADKPVSVLTGVSSFLSLVPSLLSLPASNVRPALTIHVSAQASSLAVDDEGSVTLTQVPELSSLFDAVKSLEQGGWNGAVVLSETAAEGALVGSGLAKAVTGAGYDLVNVFDGLTAGRELGHVASSTVSSGGDSSLAAVIEKSIPFFKYFGSTSASQILVIPASAYSAAAKAAVAATGNSDVGILVVRVLKPWSAEAFKGALPASAKAVHVLTEDAGDESTGSFYEEVIGSVISAGLKIKVRSLSVPVDSVPTVSDWVSIVSAIAPTSPVALKSLLPASSKLAVFWDFDGTSGKTETVPAALAQAFAKGDTGVQARLTTVYDNFRQGGLQQASLLLEPADKVTQEHSVAAIAGASPASLLFLSNAAVFKAYQPISSSSIDANTRVVISANWTNEEVPVKLPYSARKALVEAGGKSNLFVIDADKLAAAHGVRSADIAEIVFWTLYLPSTISAKEIVSVLAQTATFRDWQSAKLVEINGVVRNAITQVDVEASWADEPMDEDGKTTEQVSLPTALIATAAGANADRTFPEDAAGVIGEAKRSWHQPAQRLLFPEAFAVEQAYEEKLRPDLPEKNYLITVTENRRLTPSNYDRNVFHLEFSTAGTGLKYAVGEALGIHAWNDDDEVREFLEWYGVDPETIISMPSRVDGSRIEQRTAFQVFQQNLDIFGKPGKSFYETLSRYATNKNEERALRFIACPDGNATFKKMSEMDTVTYADLLKQFPSAKVPLSDLVREIEEIHPRHYSISSSQNFVGDSVHLLIVTVEWNTPAGQARYGQATRYLNKLRAGDKVMVSVKPSVMKVSAGNSGLTTYLI